MSDENICYGMIQTANDGYEHQDEQLQADAEDVVESYLDETDPSDWPDKITVARYKRMEISTKQLTPVDDIVESLENDFSPEGVIEFVASEELNAAEDRLLALIQKEFVPWSCEEVKGQREDFCVVSWVWENNNHWMTADEVKAFMKCHGPSDCDCARCVDPKTGKAR